MVRLILAIVAAIMLATANFFQVVAAYLGSNFWQETIMAVWLAITVVGVLLRRSWLIYIAQTVVIVFSFIPAVQYRLMGLDQKPNMNLLLLFYDLLIITFCYFMTWLLARAIGPRKV